MRFVVILCFVLQNVSGDLCRVWLSPDICNTMTGMAPRLRRFWTDDTPKIFLNSQMFGSLADLIKGYPKRKDYVNKPTPSYPNIQTNKCGCNNCPLKEEFAAHVVPLCYKGFTAENPKTTPKYRNKTPRKRYKPPRYRYTTSRSRKTTARNRYRTPSRNTTPRNRYTTPKSGDKTTSSEEKSSSSEDTIPSYIHTTPSDTETTHSTTSTTAPTTTKTTTTLTRKTRTTIWWSIRPINPGDKPISILDADNYNEFEIIYDDDGDFPE